MGKLVLLLFSLALIVSLAGLASADTFVLRDPAIVGDGAIDTTHSRIGDSSWENNGVKFESYLIADTNAQFGKTITIDDIESIEYYTFKSSAQSGVNFYISLYTEPYTGGSASWYGDRLTLEPMYSYNFNDALGVWTKWSTDSGTNQLTLFDQPKSLAYGWYYPPTLADLQAGAINWNSYLSTAPTTNVDYGSHVLKYLVVDTGSAWADTFEGSVDAITLNLKDGSSYTFDLEGPLAPTGEIIGEDTGIEVSTEDYAPKVWVNPHARVILDDNLQPGRISGPDEPMIERLNNYAFEGEQIWFDVLILDENGADDIEDVYASLQNSLGDNIEVNCRKDSDFDEFYDALLLGADRLVALQADTTEDNAGNGVSDADPDDGGWDWVLAPTATEHTAAASPLNLYGVTAEGILGAYRVDPEQTYLTAMEDVYAEALAQYTLTPADPGIRSGSDVVFLAKLSETTGDPKYRDLAEDIYIAMTTVKYPSARALAEYIREARVGIPEIIPWDLAKWVEAAKLLGYDSDAEAIADVIYDDIMGSPGYYSLTDSSLDIYGLGLTGVIDSFSLVGQHQDIVIDAIHRLLALQNPDGGFQYSTTYPTPSDLQTSAYAAATLLRAGYRPEGLAALQYVVSRQNANGGFVDEWTPSWEYPEVDAESAYGLISKIAEALEATLEAAGDEYGEYDPEIMAWYTCLFTVETPESMHGHYWVNINAEDSTGLIGKAAEREYWFLNPSIGLEFSGTPIQFGTVRPGTRAYSNTMTVGNAAEEGSGVMLDMFISGTDFYDKSHSGALCQGTNSLLLTNFAYYATNGAYSTADDSRADTEGYVGIGYGGSFNNPTPFYGRTEIMQLATSYLGYSAGNILSPGSEMSVTFRLSLPEPCNGDFSDGHIYFWGEAI